MFVISGFIYSVLIIGLGRVGPSRFEWLRDPWRLSPAMLKIKLDSHSQINIALFEELLVGYDPIETAYVVLGLKGGFSMGLLAGGPRPPERSWASSFLSNEGRLIINSYLEKEVALGRIFGPFDSPPRGEFWAGHVVYPMSVAPKKDGGHRIISNLSFGGKLLSINGFIPKNERTTSYPSFLEIAQAITFIGLSEVFFAVFDIREAYRVLNIRSEDWKYSIISWQKYSGGPRLYYIDGCMVFGGAPNCKIFNKFGDSLSHILRDAGFARDVAGVILVLQRLIKYLDDHLLMAGSAVMVNQILDRMLETMARLNIPVKDSKTIRAAPTVKFLGYMWVPRFDRITLDDKRWSEIEGRLDVFHLLLISLTASAQDLRKLTGLLVWASVVIPTAKIFNRGFHTVLQRLKATSLPASEAKLIIIDNHFLISDVLVDLSWWKDLCVSFRLSGSMPTGIKISEVVVPRVWIREECGLIFYSDASNDGVGGYQLGPVRVTPGSSPVSLWCFHNLPAGMTMTHVDVADINREKVGSGYTEAAGLLYVLYCFLPLWASAHPVREPGIGVWCHSDSECLVQMWASKRAGVSLLPYLRAFASLSAFYNITLIIDHIPGVNNRIADAISRQKFELMRQLLPDADSSPTLPLYENQIFF